MRISTNIPDHIRIYRGSERGVTLLELMVTLAIVALMAWLASTSFGGFFDQRRLAQAAEMVHADLQWARLSAMQFNNSVTVSFSGEGTTSWGYTISGAVSKSVSGVSGVTFTNSSFASDAVTFQPQGSTANAGTVRLTANSNEMRVIVSSRSRVRLCSVSGSAVDYESC